MARYEKIHLGTIRADLGPTGNAGTSDSGGSIDGLDLSGVRCVIVGDKIAAIGSDGESAPGIEDDIDNVMARVA
jgi:hypothetical protein